MSCLIATPCRGVSIGVFESRDHVFDHSVLTGKGMDGCMAEWIVGIITTNCSVYP